VLVCLSAAAPTAPAVSPAPDGGYPGGNTAEGQAALLSLTAGGFNTAVGYLSLRNNTTNSFNTAIGAGTLVANGGDQNTAVGAGALLSNTIGDSNTANGAFALFSNSTGSDNTAMGDSALLSNTIGFGNTANGAGALFSNTMGNANTAVGISALYSNTTGDNNTGTGINALGLNTVGNNNTAVGSQALSFNNDGSGNTAIGRNALGNTTGSFNIALGANAGSALTTGDNDIDIGTDVIGVAGEANTIRIGNPNITSTYIRGISGVTASGGAAVYVTANGQLGTITSSARFKDEIKPMQQASEVLYALQPVTFRYKEKIDPQRKQQFGLVAEDVEKINSDLVVRDENGKLSTVRYDAVNAMLLNEFLKEHRKVEKLKATVAELAAQLKRVSVQVQMDHPAAQVAANHQ